jgi:uncharacterized protein
MSTVKKVVNLVQERFDSWYSALTGLGDALRDKVAGASFMASPRLPDQLAENLYHDNDMAAKVCDALPRAGLRKGFRVVFGDDADLEQAEAIQSAWDDSGARTKFLSAAIWARVFGGAGVLLGIDDGQPMDQPVDENRIRAIRYMTVLDKRDITPASWYNEPGAEKFGQPKLFRLNSFSIIGAGDGGMALSNATAAGALIHESRIITFPGAHTSLRRKLRNEGWDESVLQRVHEVLREFGTGWQAVAHLMQDASQGVFKIKGLIDMVASGDKETLHNRMQLVDISRSVARAIMVDAESESFERVHASFAGLPELLRMLILRLAGAAEMPATVLMGMAPAGMNATGESDIRIWYDAVQDWQTEVMKPRIERVLRLLLLAKESDLQGEPDGWEVKFNPLWQMTDKEQAELEKLVADKDAVYIDKQVLLPEEVALSRHTATGFSMHTQIDLDTRREMLDAELELMKEKAGEEPPPQMPPPGAPLAEGTPPEGVPATEEK